MSNNNTYQVVDDVDCLSKMMEDLSIADTLYKPTNYWMVYEKFFLPELLKKRLYNFRRRRKSVLESFGATDTVIRAELETNIKLKMPHSVLKVINSILNNSSIIKLIVSSSLDLEGITLYFYKEINNKFKLANMDLKRCPTSPGMT